MSTVNAQFSQFGATPSLGQTGIKMNSGANTSGLDTSNWGSGAAPISPSTQSPPSGGYAPSTGVGSTLANGALNGNPTIAGQQVNPPPSLLSGLIQPSGVPSSHTVTQNNVDGSSTTTKQTYDNTGSSGSSSTSPTPSTNIGYGNSSSTAQPVPPITPPNNTNPNGNQVNTGTVTPSGTTYPGLINTLANSSQTNNSTLGQNAQNIATAAGNAISNIGQAGARGQAGYLSTGTSPVGEGNAAILGQTTAAEQQAIAQGAKMQLSGNAQALTGQNQAQSGLYNAGTLASPSATQTTLSPSQTQYSTVTGQPVAGLNAGGGTSGDVTSLAQQVANGTMPYATAVQSLGYQGGVGQQALDQAITGINPNFNFAQAQSNVATQGTLATQGSLATQELSNLQTTLASTPGLENTASPVVNALTRWLGGLAGNQPTQALNDAQSAAKSAVETALGTAYGGTPTSFDSLVGAWFPPGATASQIQAGIDQFNTLMTARQRAYSSPGNTTINPSGSAGGTTSGTGTNFTNGQTAGGGALVYQNGQWTVANQ